jgi:hypothetical protein
VEQGRWIQKFGELYRPLENEGIDAFQVRSLADEVVDEVTKDDYFALASANPDEFPPEEAARRHLSGDPPGARR